jgi:sensor histidine kinase YesM
MPLLMDRLRRSLADASLITKITLLYVVAILVPSVSTTVLSYQQSRLRAEEKIARTNERIFEAVYADVLRAMRGAETVGDQLSFNAELRRFLSVQYEGDAAAVLEYTGKISPIVAYAQLFQGGDIDGIKVYYVNRTIPEFWVHFYSEDRLLVDEWYQEFRKTESDSTWVFPGESAVRSPFLDLESDLVLSYARKVFDPQRRLLGTIVVDLSAESLLADLHKFSGESGCFGLVDSAGGTVVNACTANAQSDQPFPRLAGPVDSASSVRTLRVGDHSYSLRGIPAGDYVLLHRTETDAEVTRMILHELLTVFIIIAVVLVLEAIAFFGLRVFLRRLRLITTSMNSAAEGNFQMRIPVTGRDEIGQITEDFNAMIGKIKDLVDENVKRETAQKNAQLMALQYQLNPHFVYNMIDTFRMKLVIQDSHEIAESLAHFGKMLRYNISASDPYSTLGEEITYAEQYLAIQRLRYEDRVVFSSAVPRSDYDTRILRFVLQPVIENSVKHGLRDGHRNLHVRLRGRRIGDLYEVVVEDDGLGMEEERVSELNESLKRHDRTDRGEHRAGEGIGLFNISERLRLYYGGGARIFLESSRSRTRTTLVFPFSVKELSR